MKIKSRIITKEEYDAILNEIRNGNPKEKLKPNERIALLLSLMAEEGTRLKTALAITPESIKAENGYYKASIDGDEANMSIAMYGLLMSYCMASNIGPKEKIFPFTERNVQNILKKGAHAANIPDKGIAPQSFRKYFVYNKVQTEGIDAAANALKTTRYRIKDFIKDK